MMTWHSRPGGIGLKYFPETNGGGIWFGQEYTNMIQKLYPGRIFNCCYEWCSGPGFIGFALFDAKLCANLFFSDIYRPAIECIRATVVENACLNGLVDTCVTGLVDKIPKDKKFDLVIANPPHFVDGPAEGHMHRIKVDCDWAVHKEFFLNISQYLTPDAVILLQENRRGSPEMDKTWGPWIKQGGLEVQRVIPSPDFNDYDDHTSIYYIELTKANWQEKT